MALAAVILVPWLVREKIEDAAVALCLGQCRRTGGARGYGSGVAGRAAMFFRAVAKLSWMESYRGWPAGSDGNDYTFRVRSAPDDPMVNAFAAPGGYIVLLSRAA